MKIVVIGGSGLIGKAHEQPSSEWPQGMAISLSSGVNSLTSKGVAEALAGAQVGAAKAPLR
jgi:hypothetical protein